MSKIVKGIKKGVKKLGKGLKKTWKRVSSSTIGKILIAGAVIYFGGAALGAWGGWGGASTVGQAALGSTVVSPVSGAVASAALPTAATSSIVGGGMMSAAPAAGVLGASTTAANSMAAVSALNAGGAAASGGLAATGGLIKSAMTGVGKFAATPLGGAAITSGIQAALTPSEEELINKENARRQANYDVSGVNLNFASNYQAGAVPQANFSGRTQRPAIKRPGLIGSRI